MSTSEIILYILGGARVTLVVVAMVLPTALLAGLLVALLRLYGGVFLSRAMALYSAVMRGVPPITLLFLLYYMISRAIHLSPLLAGILSLAIVSSAYQSEVFRGAILSVASDQEMAARSIGMSRLKAIRHIVLPQALRLAIPPWSNEVTMIIKDSSLVYALGVAEILRRSQYMSASTYKPFLAYGTAAAFYFLLTFVAARLLGLVEKRTTIPSN